MVVLLVPGAAEELSLGPETLRQLAALGVTHLAVLRDEQTVGLVLQRWAFDPQQSAAALRTLVAASDDTRTRVPLSQASVSPAADDRSRS
jgi:NifB/MoaA-like Fe-S oxidoreductase